MMPAFQAHQRLRSGRFARGWLPTAVLALATMLAAVSPALAQEAGDRLAPEIATAAKQPKLATARQFMVVAAHPLAAEAGRAILAGGGNAIDAMVAVQLVLGLVEPQSSGLGGGAFLVYRDKASGIITTFDGRETAPAAATPDLFLDGSGKPLGFFDAVIGGRSVGTPGTPALLETAHRRFGRLDWASLFEPAIRLAEEGFEVSPRLNAAISAAAESLYRYPATRDYFLSEEGVPLFAGTRLRNPAYADTLRAIAAEGARAFYQGPIAADIVASVRGADDNPGLLSTGDLAGYQVKEREPVCFAYRAYEICGIGPPSSGTLTVGQILGLIEPYDIAGLGPESPESWRLVGDASRLAFADREAYMADSDFVTMPRGLLNRDYLKERSKLLAGARALPAEAVRPGQPPFDRAMAHPPGLTPELPSTSHFSIVDADGNVVSMTTTIENAFGSRLMVRGFLLNNELTDFSFVAERDGRPVANRVEPGKRPRSSMAPVIVLKDGEPYLVLGSPGGSRIIGFVAQALIAVLDWRMPLDQAMAMPHLVNRFGVFEIEAGTLAEQLAPALEALGYEIGLAEMSSGLNAIRLADGVIEGAADPRREGVALGQ